MLLQDPAREDVNPERLDTARALSFPPSSSTPPPLSYRTSAAAVVELSAPASSSARHEAGAPSPASRRILLARDPNYLLIKAPPPLHAAAAGCHGPSSGSTPRPAEGGIASRLGMATEQVRIGYPWVSDSGMIPHPRGFGFGFGFLPVDTQWITVSNKNSCFTIYLIVTLFFNY